MEKGGTEKQLTAYRERLRAYKAHKTWRQTPAAEGEDRVGNLNPARSQGQKNQDFQEESAAGSQAITPKIFSVQVGAFKSRKNAEKVTARLKKRAMLPGQWP
jgi:cell division septation protein DedD